MKAPFRLPLQLVEATTTIPIKDNNGKTIATVKYGENDFNCAEYIRRACNSHDELVTELDETTHRLVACKNALQRSMVEGKLKRDFIIMIDADIIRNRATLSKAREGK